MGATGLVWKFSSDLPNELEPDFSLWFEVILRGFVFIVNAIYV